MLCEKCGKNEATIHYSEIINGKKTTYTLCHECAESLGVGKIPDPFGSSAVTSLFSGIFGDMFIPSQAVSQQRRAQNEKHCPVCQSTLREIAAEGKVGCPECYRAFRDELRPTIRRIHGDTSYKGKTAVADDPEAERKNEIAALRAELDEAIKSEDFERAAELRDKIRAMSE